LYLNCINVLFSLHQTDAQRKSIVAGGGFETRLPERSPI